MPEIEARSVSYRPQREWAQHSGMALRMSANLYVTAVYSPNPQNLIVSLHWRERGTEMRMKWFVCGAAVLVTHWYVTQRVCFVCVCVCVCVCVGVCVCV